MTIGPEFLTRIERWALLLTVLLAGAAFAWPSGGANAAGGVLGGALIAGVSYFSVRRGVDGLTGALANGASARGTLARALIILVGRYALLALIAYVMISRLRLSPLGVLMGVSVIPLAATIQTIEALASSRKTGRGNHGRV